jgi:ferric-dicitrate binding protein FerR (iron transport regulator)
MRNMDRIRLLICRYFDGTATAEEIGELERAGREDEDVRRELMLIAHQDREIESVLKGDEDIRTVAKRRRPASRRGRARWLVWLSVAACLAIIVGALVYNARQEERFVEVLVARVRKTSPDVKVLRAADGKTVVAVVGMELFDGDRIEARKGQRVVIGYPYEKTTITAGSGDRDTAVRIGDAKEGKRLLLEKGILDASVAPQPADRHMVITTPQARAEVVGTVFCIDVDLSPQAAGSRDPRSGSTLVETYEGRVRVADLFGGGEVAVEAGQRVVVRHPVKAPLTVAAISGWQGLRTGPGGEKLRSYRWTFEKGPAEELEVLAGPWRHEGDAMIADPEGAVVILPVRLRGIPALVQVDATLAGRPGVRAVYFLENGVRSPSFKRGGHAGPKVIKGRPGQLFNALIEKRYIVWWSDADSRGKLLEYERPCDGVLAVIGNYRVRSISLREVGPDEIPERFRGAGQIRKLKKELPEWTTQEQLTFERKEESD